MALRGVPELAAFDPATFAPVCVASDALYRTAQGSVNLLVGPDVYKEYAPLIAGGLLRVRLELCVVESFFGEAVTLASSTYALRLAARVPGANRARTYGVLLSLFDAGGACGAALSAALARHVVYGVWEHVPRLVMVCSALAVGPLGLLFLV